MSRFALADVDVPAQFAEWAYEFKLGYNDGSTKKKYAWRPALGDTDHNERLAAYRAGRAAGRKVFPVPPTNHHKRTAR